MQKFISAVLLCWFSAVHAAEEAKVEETKNLFTHPIYFGGVGGWGSTTWQGLVPNVENQNSAIIISTPVVVDEGGAVWGLSLGYEFTPFFALEANYMAFPDAKITFDEYSLYAFDQSTVILNTQTQTASFSGKIMLMVPKTSVRFFSSVGIASVFRQDQINDTYRISPTFGFGANYLLTERVMLEIGANYTAGYGESEINPVLDFVPFLYSVFGKVSLRFG